MHIFSATLYYSLNYNSLPYLGMEKLWLHGFRKDLKLRIDQGSVAASEKCKQLMRNLEAAGLKPNPSEVLNEPSSDALSGDTIAVPIIGCVMLLAMAKVDRTLPCQEEVEKAMARVRAQGRSERFFKVVRWSPPPATPYDNMPGLSKKRRCGRT